MANRKRTMTPEEEAWAAGYDERTRRLRERIERGYAAMQARERRRRRPLLLRWLPF